MRLIDADLLREDILRDNTFDNDTVNHYLAMVDGMETAYDMEKVVEQMKELVRTCVYNHDWHGQSRVEDCIEIVKGAVKDE